MGYIFALLSDCGLVMIDELSGVLIASKLA